MKPTRFALTVAILAATAYIPQDAAQAQAGANAQNVAMPRPVITFTPEKPETKIQLAELRNRAPLALPADWSEYNFLVIEWRATSSERFQLQLFANDGEGGKEVMVAKRISPFQNTWVRAAIPLDFFRRPARDGFDLAATYNKPRQSYWININFGGWAPIKNVTAIGFQMDTPIGSGGFPTLEIRSMRLSKEDPGDEVLEPRVVVDQFGQWVPTDWPGKAKTVEDLQKAWAAEAAALKPGDFGYDKYGGYASTTARATGFFRVEQVDGKWWFITPDGHHFFSTGANGIGTNSGTPTGNRATIFEALPASGGGGRGGGRGGGGGGGNFYGANLQRRYGANFQQAWGELTFRRLDAWGVNTVAGFSNTPPANITLDGARKPYTIMLRNWGGGGGGRGGGAGGATTIMGLPDVYSDAFATSADQVAQQQCAPLKDDPYLLGYFVGNEPPWPGRESMLCDAIIAGPETATKAKLRETLAQGDTPARRKQFAYDAFDRYLAVINAAVKKADPNHINLGIRLGGEVADEVIRACRVFDVCSLNVYDFAISEETLNRFAKLTGRPLLGGEFHFGAPERGLSGGLRQVASQTDRGLAYSYYVEHAAAHPNVIGMHWFQFIDQPATGRNDGENYNIGIIDVTDRPYEELTAALIRSHKRLLDVHTGKIPPTNIQPKGKSTAEILLNETTMIPPPH